MKQEKEQGEMKQLCLFLLTIFIAISAEARDYDPDRFGDIVNIVYSRDGKYIAAAELGGLIRIYDSITMGKVSEFNGHSIGYFLMEFSPDNLYIALYTVEEGNGVSQEILIFEIKTGNLILKLDDQSKYGEIKSISYRFDGQRLVSGYSDGSITIWDIVNRVEIMNLKNRPRDWIFTVSYSPDGNKIISASTRNIKIWDANNGMELKTLYELDDDYNSILIEVNTAYSHDNKKILTAYWKREEGGVIKLYDSDNYDLLYSYNIIGNGIIFVTQVSFILNSNFIIICYRERNDPDYNNRIVIMDYTDGSIINILKLTTHAAISPDGRKICYSENEKDIKIMDVFNE